MAGYTLKENPSVGDPLFLSMYGRSQITAVSSDRISAPFSTSEVIPFERYPDRDIIKPFTIEWMYCGQTNASFYEETITYPLKLDAWLSIQNTTIANAVTWFRTDTAPGAKVTQSDNIFYVHGT